MAAPFVSVAVPQYPRLAPKEAAEERRWNALKFPVVHKLSMAVTSIHFSPAKPYDYAVAASNKVVIYDSQTNREKKSFMKFQSNDAASPHFRSDGKLLVAADTSGLVQVFDVGGRAVLRRFTGHTKATRWARFGLDATQVLSASDDMTARCWDLATETETAVYTGHTDYVRAGCVHTTDSNLFITGSYDHHLRLWDIRSKDCVKMFAHHQPVEAVTMANSGSIFVSAGGNYIKVWDIMSGKCMAEVSNHQKTITSLCFDAEGGRLLSAGLDRMVKVYDVSSWAVVHTLKYPMPLLSVGLSPVGSHLAAGMTNGLLEVRYRGLGDSGRATAPKKTPRAGTKRFFLRGANHKPEPTDQVVSTKRKKLKPHDKMIKKFEYAEALDSVLMPPNNKKPTAVLVVAVLNELNQRDGLSKALNGRDEAALLPVLKFLLKNICNPRYAGLLITVANVVLDIYGGTAELSPAVDTALRQLRDTLQNEIDFQRELFKLLGAIDAVVATSTA